MTKSIYYDRPCRTMLDADLDEFVRDEARRHGITRAAVVRQAVAARRQKVRDEGLHVAALHRAIEREVERSGALT